MVINKEKVTELTIIQEIGENCLAVRLLPLLCFIGSIHNNIIYEKDNYISVCFIYLRLRISFLPGAGPGPQDGI